MMNELEGRLKEVLTNSRSAGMDTTLRVIRSDVFELLSAFMEISPENLSVTAEVTDGEVFLTVKANTKRLYEVGKTVET